MFLFFIAFIFIIALFLCLLGDEQRPERPREPERPQEPYDFGRHGRIDMRQRIDQSIPGLIPMISIIWGREYVNGIINQTNRLVNADENEITQFIVNQLSNNHQHPLVRQLLEIIEQQGGTRGADDELLSNLRVKKYRRRGEKEECGICLSDFEAGERVIELPNCIHFYHGECVVPWLKINKSCPTCRTNVDN